MPLQFAIERAILSWQDVQFGIVNDLLDPDAAIDLAAQQVADSESPSETLVELAGTKRGSAPGDLVTRLAADERAVSETELREKWLYLVLSWLYDQRATNPDPLRSVEEVYADFGYPQEVAAFVRYMPADGPSLGSKEANERQLLQRWGAFLDACALRYGSHTADRSR
jgi:hypothetical protein